VEYVDAKGNRCIVRYQQEDRRRTPQQRRMTVCAFGLLLGLGVGEGAVELAGDVSSHENAQRRSGPVAMQFDDTVIFAAAGWAEQEFSVSSMMMGTVFLFLVWSLVAYLAYRALQTCMELVFCRSQISLRQILLYMLGVAIVAALCLFTYSLG
jgi:hypothetical protein